MNINKKNTDISPTAKKSKETYKIKKIKKNANIEISLEIKTLPSSGEVMSVEITDMNLTTSVGSQSPRNKPVSEKQNAKEKLDQSENSQQGIINAIIMALFILGIAFAIYYTTFSTGK